MLVRAGVADRGEGMKGGNGPATALRRWRREFVDIRHMDRRTSRRMRTESRVPKLEGSAQGEPPLLGPLFQFCGSEEKELNQRFAF